MLLDRLLHLKRKTAGEKMQEARAKELGLLDLVADAVDLPLSPAANSSGAKPVLTVDLPNGAPSPTALAPLPDVPRRVVVLLEEILPRIPTRVLKPGLHDPVRELHFAVEELSAGIARGRPTAALSRLAEMCPDVFESPVHPGEDLAVPLPLQTLLPQLDAPTRKPVAPVGAVEVSSTPTAAHPLEVIEVLPQSITPPADQPEAAQKAGEEAAPIEVPHAPAGFMRHTLPLFPTPYSQQEYDPEPPATALEEINGVSRPPIAPLLPDPAHLAEEAATEPSSPEPTASSTPDEPGEMHANADAPRFAAAVPVVRPPEIQTGNETPLADAPVVLPAPEDAEPTTAIPSEPLSPVPFFLPPPLVRPSFQPPPLFGKAPPISVLPPQPQSIALAPAVPKAELSIPQIPFARFDQTRLQALFMTDELLDLPKICGIIADLPSVEGCTIAVAEKVVQRGDWPPELDPPMLQALEQRLAEATAAFGTALPPVQTLSIFGHERAISFFAGHEVSLCVAHSARGFLPGVREKLAAAAEALADGYFGGSGSL